MSADRVGDTAAVPVGVEDVECADGNLRAGAVDQLQFRRHPEWPFGLVEPEDEGRASSDRKTVRDSDLDERHQEFVHAEIGLPATE